MLTELIEYDEIYKDKFDNEHNELRKKVIKEKDVFKKLELINSFYKNIRNKIHEEIVEDQIYMMSPQTYDKFINDLKNSHNGNTCLVQSWLHKVEFKSYRIGEIILKNLSLNNEEKDFFVGSLKRYLKDVNTMDWDVIFLENQNG